MLRRRSRSEPEPQGAPDHPGVHPLQAWAASLPARWQPPVHRALGSRAQFFDVVARAAPGPTRERLESMGATVDEAVQRVADTAWRASNAEAIAARLDARAAAEDLKAARRQLDDARRTDADLSALEQRVATLAERHRAVNDALNLSEDAGARLDELNVRLETVVAQAATVVLRATQDDRVEALEGELQEVVVGLRALDGALEDVGRVG